MKMDYKATLNLPKTAFSMKANLPGREPKRLEAWEKMNVYRELMKRRKGSPKYILHDGPPYANGDIHAGHVLNKVLKDITLKYKSLQGFDCPFVPGWDCHGLPVEHQLFKELGITKYDIDKVLFRKKAKDFALGFVAVQKEQFKRLGIFGDWEHPYITLDPQYESAIIKCFQDLVREGFLYRGLKPINWCVKCETALAEAEVEYEEHNSPSVYVKFKLFRREKSEDRGQRKLSSEQLENTYFVIWTTTPWTLVANVAVALHPELDYVLVKAGEEILILAKDLLDVTMKKIGRAEFRVIDTFKGRAMEGLECVHPFISRRSRVVLADYVSNQEGTGCVHTAPGHGAEDYGTGLKYKLPVIMPVAEDGKFLTQDDIPAYLKGKNVFSANSEIIKNMSESGHLLYEEKLTHSYPYCWRCKQPVITRATRQWFINVDNKDLRARALRIIKDVNWVPESGERRISSMVSNRPDWCLSRQRYWGVPIPVFYCEECDQEILDPDLIELVRQKVAKYGSDIWFIKSAKELLPKGFKCPHCKGETFKKEEDIIDVWFDSGVSHQAVLEQRKELLFPADLYLEGSDQHRGWFQAALLTSVGIKNEPPFKTVLTHGFVVDGKGKKMSKSRGNVVSPQDVIKDYGADILRLWVAASDYNEDVRISEEILGRLAEAYRKIRNTCRFLLGNLDGFHPKRHTLEFNKMLEIDRWALSRVSTLYKETTEFYNTFVFHKVYRSLYHFCTVPMSSFYLDVLKDRLYTFSRASDERRSAETAMYRILSLLVKIMAPILAFTAEEVYELMPREDDIPSVHLSTWPGPEIKDWFNPELETRWERLIEIRSRVLKVLEEKREKGELGNSLEAEVELSLKEGELYQFLKSYEDKLASIFIVSAVSLERQDGGEDLIIRSRRAAGGKCERCWNYSDRVGENRTHPTLCARCVGVVTGKN